MAVLTGNTTTVAIALTTADLVEQPAGGWGSWIPPVIAQFENPLKTGTTIYTPTVTEIQGLRRNNLITDESSLFYQLRIKNTTRKLQQTSDVYSLQISSGRIWRALSAMEQLGMISRFSVDELRLSWIKLLAAKTGEQIKADWQRKYINDVGYVHEVLENLRGTSTTQSVPIATLYPDWQITNLMLGDCLNSLTSASRNIASATIANITVEWRSPVPTTGISKEELQGLWKSALIGDTFYCYCAMRSLKAGLNQAIAPQFFLENFSITPNNLLQVLYRLRNSNIITRIHMGLTTFKWNLQVPQYDYSWAVKLQRSFFSEAGDFMFLVGGLNTSKSTEQTVNMSDIVRRIGLKTKKLDSNIDASEIAIALVLRMVENGVVTILSSDPISITWAY